MRQQGSNRSSRPPSREQGLMGCTFHATSTTHAIDNLFRSCVVKADQQLMEACRPKRERKASLKGKEAAEQEPYNQEEAGSRSGKRVAGSRLFVLSWWLSLFRSFFCFCESLDLCCAGAVRRSQTFVPITRRSTDLYSPPFCVLYCESLPLCLRLPPPVALFFFSFSLWLFCWDPFYFLSNNTSVISSQV